MVTGACLIYAHGLHWGDYNGLYICTPGENCKIDTILSCPHLKMLSINTSTKQITFSFDAMSVAFNIFLAGHKRYCYKHSTFMYHQIHCKKSGKYQDLVEDRIEMDNLNKQIEEYVLERTKLTKEDIADIREKKKDFYIHSDKAIEYGIVDEVL